MSTTPALPVWRCLVWSARFWIGLALIALFVLLVFSSAERYRNDRTRDQRFERDGVPAKAVVSLKMNLKDRYGRSTSWSVSYDYRDGDGGLHHGNGLVTKESWEQLDQGGTLPIVYLRDEPGMSRPASEEGNRLPGVITAAMMICMASGILQILGIGILQIIVAVGEASRQSHCPECEGMCSSCGAPANRACRCGKFCCAMHGGQSSFGSSCVECYNRRRHWGWIGFVFQVGIGFLVLFLAMPAKGEFAGSAALLALMIFAVAGFYLWSAIRTF